MSTYNFAPASVFNSQPGFVTWLAGFSSEELNAIEKYCDNLEKSTATTGTSEAPNEDNINVRVSEVSWVNLTDDSNLMYDRLAYIVRQINAEFYNFDISGFVEDFQYTTYYGSKNGHYTWHRDQSASISTSRKLSLVLQLSDPDEYEGGDLQIWTDADPITVEKSKGMIAVFPSWAIHRVTPVTKGIRKSLVVWIAGPAFR